MKSLVAGSSPAGLSKDKQCLRPPPLDPGGCYDSGKKVTAIVSRLVALGLLSIGESKLLQRLWHVTEQGDQVLARYP